MSLELVALKNGLVSLRCQKSRETFHPVTGPMAEAEILHVRQQRIVERAREEGGFILWDVGLGAAANALAAWKAFQETNEPVEIHSFDKTLEPLGFAIDHALELGYLLPFRETLARLIAERGVKEGNRSWILHEGDFREEMKEPGIPSPQGIFFDPYSPVSNPEMWNLSLFRALRERLDKKCLWTNYTRSTSVRATLLLAGFFVGYGEAVGEKDQTTAASNDFHALAHPLERNWLERVEISRNGAPIRESATPGAISKEDLRALASLPQFQ